MNIFHWVVKAADRQTLKRLAMQRDAERFTTKEQSSLERFEPRGPTQVDLFLSSSQSVPSGAFAKERPRQVT